MGNIRVVIGANWGDEGKGLMTDVYCNSFNLALNVRFNGGAQAGHTVVTPDGRRHVFHSVGAGSFNPGTQTYLSSFFLLNPIELRREMEYLHYLGVDTTIFISNQCRVVIPNDCFINMALERSRGAARHGSCGQGIWEAVLRNGYKRLSVSELKHHKDDFYTYIHATYGGYWANKLEQEHIDITNESVQEVINYMEDTDIARNFIEDFEWVLSHCKLVDDNTILSDYTNLVFEGAQGLILDRDNQAFWPNISATNTGLRNVKSLLKHRHKQEDDTEVCYVTRSYFTRHGAGRFSTECRKEQLGSNIYDHTNIPNEFQGSMRFGWFDLDTFRYFVNQDIEQFDIGGRKVVSVTHLDQTGGLILTQPGADYYNINAVGDLVRHVGLDGAYTSFGDTRLDVRRQ